MELWRQYLIRCNRWAPFCGGSGRVEKGRRNYYFHIGNFRGCFRKSKAKTSKQTNKLARVWKEIPRDKINKRSSQTQSWNSRRSSALILKLSRSRKWMIRSKSPFILFADCHLIFLSPFILSLFFSNVCPFLSIPLCVILFSQVPSDSRSRRAAFFFSKFVTMCRHDGKKGNQAT